MHSKVLKVAINLNVHDIEHRFVRTKLYARIRSNSSELLHTISTEKDFRKKWPAPKIIFDVSFLGKYFWRKLQIASPYRSNLLVQRSVIVYSLFAEVWLNKRSLNIIDLIHFKEKKQINITWQQKKNHMHHASISSISITVEVFQVFDQMHNVARWK